MYCNNCGAAVVGKFCSCCGHKVSDPIKEFRLAERRSEKEFMNRYRHTFFPRFGECKLELQHVAKACWLACLTKYGRDTVIPSGVLNPLYTVSPDAYEKLARVQEHAMRLFERILADPDY